LFLHLIDLLVFDGGHQDVKVVLSSIISYPVEHDLGSNINFGTFSNKDSFKSLEHLEDMTRVHTPIIIRVTNLEHQFDFLVLGYS